MSANNELIYKEIEFTEVSAEFNDLVVFTPKLPIGADWAYLGQVAWKRGGESNEHKGLIWLAKDGSDALGDIADWEPVMHSIEPTPFTTWRGVPADPERYVSGGDFFVLGMDKPTAAQTARIKAIRRDLVFELQPQRLVWEGRLPFSVLTIWDIAFVDTLHVVPGAFASTESLSPEGLTLPVVVFNA